MNTDTRAKLNSGSFIVGVLVGNADGGTRPSFYLGRYPAYTVGGSKAARAARERKTEIDGTMFAREGRKT